MFGRQCILSFPIDPYTKEEDPIYVALGRETNLLPNKHMDEIFPIDWVNYNGPFRGRCVFYKDKGSVRVEQIQEIVTIIQEVIEQQKIKTYAKALF